VKSNPAARQVSVPRSRQSADADRHPRRRGEQDLPPPAGAERGGGLPKLLHKLHQAYWLLFGSLLWMFLFLGGLELILQKAKPVVAQGIELIQIARAAPPEAPRVEPSLATPCTCSGSHGCACQRRSLVSPSCRGTACALAESTRLQPRTP
jgi:hypothetical protein